MKATSNQNIALAIHSLLRDKSGVAYQGALRNVILFLNRKKLLSQTKDLLRRLDEISDKEAGILRVKISSARVLERESKSDLEKLLKSKYAAKDIVLEEKLESDLLGGVRIEVLDEVLDLTMKNRIKILEHSLLAHA